jgi:hypothetical protein
MANRGINWFFSPLPSSFCREKGYLSKFNYAGDDIGATALLPPKEGVTQEDEGIVVADEVFVTAMEDVGR